MKRTLLVLVLLASTVFAEKITQEIGELNTSNGASASTLTFTVRKENGKKYLDLFAYGPYGVDSNLIILDAEGIRNLKKFTAQAETALKRMR